MAETFPMWLMRNHAGALAEAGLPSAGLFFLRYGRPLTGEVAFTVLDKAGTLSLEGVCDPRAGLIRLETAKAWDGVCPPREMEDNLIPLPAAGTDALERYLPDAVSRPAHVSAQRLARAMGIRMRSGLLSAGGETLGRTCFGERGIEVVLDDDAILRRRADWEEVLLHELAHCLRDLPFLSLDAVSPREKEEISLLEENTRRYALELAMPEKAMRNVDWGKRYPEARVAAAFGVPVESARARLERLLPTSITVVQQVHLPKANTVLPTSGVSHTSYFFHRANPRVSEGASELPSGGSDAAWARLTRDGNARVLRSRKAAKASCPVSQKNSVPQPPRGTPSLFPIYPLRENRVQGIKFPAGVGGQSPRMAASRGAPGSATKITPCSPN